MSTDEQRAHVRDVVRRLLGVNPGENAGRWYMEGTYRGVAVSFSTSDLPEFRADDIDASFKVDTRVSADYPRDYPLYLTLRDGADSSRSEAAFFAFFRGQAAPLDIVERVLNETVCDGLRRLKRFNLDTIDPAEIIRTRKPPSISLSVPRWVETPDTAQLMLEIVATLILGLDDARTAADAAAAANASTPYRGGVPDLDRLHKQRLAEIKAERRR